MRQLYAPLQVIFARGDKKAVNSASASRSLSTGSRRAGFGCQFALHSIAFLPMAEVVQDTQQEFWRSPTVLEPAVETALPAVRPGLAQVCAHCGTEFMIGAQFCHACGLCRTAAATSTSGGGRIASWWSQTATHLHRGTRTVVAAWRAFSAPSWMQRLHFHEIKRSVGLPTASLIAFFIGLGCVTGALAVSLFYRASNLAEFEAIQMWRIQWLLGATASFVAGILLKKSSAKE